MIETGKALNKQLEHLEEDIGTAALLSRESTEAFSRMTQQFT